MSGCLNNRIESRSFQLNSVIPSVVACVVIDDVVVAVVDGMAVGITVVVVGIDGRVPATVVDREVNVIEDVVVGDVVVVAVFCVVVLVEVSFSKKLN